MTKYRLLGLLLLIVFVGLVVFSLQSAKDVSVQVPISSQVSSQDESISMESSSIMESSSVTESVHDEPLEVPEDTGKSSSQESELKTSLPEKEKEDISLSENYWKEQKIWDEQQVRYNKLENYLEEHLKDTQYSSMRFLSGNHTESQTLEIWATDSEAVQEKLEEYAEIENISDLNISLQSARYSMEVLLPIRDAIRKMEEGRIEREEPFLINFCTILKDFVYISVPEKTEELDNFLEENDFEDYVEIEAATAVNA